MVIPRKQRTPPLLLAVVKSNKGARIMEESSKAVFNVHIRVGAYAFLHKDMAGRVVEDHSHQQLGYETQQVNNARHDIPALQAQSNDTGLVVVDVVFVIVAGVSVDVDIAMSGVSIHVSALLVVVFFLGGGDDFDTHNGSLSRR